MKRAKAQVPAPGRPNLRVRRKSAQILRAARDLFLERGYAVTSMDAIAEHAVVSKATLYNNYESKEELFSQIVRNFMDRYSPSIVDEDADEKDVRITLLRMGRSIVSLALASDDVAAHRMVVAEAARSPELGELYYQAGPMRLHSHLDHILKRAMGRGQLRRASTSHAAAQFVAMVIGNLHLEALLCVGKKISKKTRDGVIKSGVDAFYRAYAPK